MYGAGQRKLTIIRSVRIKRMSVKRGSTVTSSSVQHKTTFLEALHNQVNIVISVPSPLPSSLLGWTSLVPRPNLAYGANRAAYPRLGTVRDSANSSRAKNFRGRGAYVDEVKVGTGSFFLPNGSSNYNINYETNLQCVLG